VSNADILGLRKNSSDAKKSELLKHEVHGGFKREIYDKVVNDKAFLAQITQEFRIWSVPGLRGKDLLSIGETA